MQNLLNTLQNYPIVIWGARMTGIGFLRFARSNNLNVIAFIDSDPSLSNKIINSIPVYQSSQIALLKQQYPNLIVVIAASVKEDEIIASLPHNIQYINFHDYSPSFYTIDVSGTCNLKCPSCANSLHTHKKGFMSLSDFEKIINKAITETPILTHIALYNWGEPLLHPALSEIIDYAHSKNIAASVSTNFSIKNSEQLQKLVWASPDIFKVSLSGYYPETYNKTHTGGNINLVKSNLYRLRYLMDGFKSTFPVEVNYHLYRHNLSEVPKMQSLCKELDFIFSTTPATITPVERIITLTKAPITSLLLNDISKTLALSLPFKHLPCRLRTNQININWDRSVSLCCASEPIIHPDYLTTTLSEIDTLKNKHPLCNSCTSIGAHQFHLQINQESIKKELGI
jgi:MoaA/NifB/PqqE/SkfB family radical SAM enzyme